MATGYPASATVPPQNPEFVAAYQKRYNEVPKLGAIVGYLTIKSMAAGITKAGSTDTEKVVDAFQGLQLSGPFGPFQFRAVDHQSTLGGYVGKIDAGAVAQAIDDAKPDAIFSAEFGADLAQFVREGNTRG
ncbi:MAG: ABC transporter substrate-binding protein, partial [Xanthobacteraceae bacterium]